MTGSKEIAKLNSPLVEIHSFPNKYIYLARHSDQLYEYRLSSNGRSTFYTFYRITCRLGIDYELNTYECLPLLAAPAYKALHPAESAPVIQDGDLTLAESGGCMGYFRREYTNGELFPDQTHPSYG
ncbi:glutathione S-transferase [Penicillium canescens]|uniref:glutathione S-transferase n=1 Tax=Penicillium canescens TaxID=5083 RepID=UPI0026DF4A90|nr:glutathione S-transferase [Penicillium canescens]KAJ6011763.1 glutathione S-transferase [Penicillium canescens]KAJ6077148.1 glutathione S-transferase [Penicillium canescens]KAJ6153917.1 glutathione S-transferase [Penicillium canescens]